MGLSRTTNYRGFMVKTLVQPSRQPNVGFVGYVSVYIGIDQTVRDHTDIMSHFHFAETAAMQLGREMLDVILGAEESQQD